jgi:transposase
VPVKSEEDQAALMLLKTRDLLVKQRTMLINASRGHAAEFGVIGAKGPQKITALLERVGEDIKVPALAREMLGVLAAQLATIKTRLERIEARLMMRHKSDARSQKLATIPGVGPIGAVSFSLKVPDAKAFGSGRHFAAYDRNRPEPFTLPHLARAGAVHI